MFPYLLGFARSLGNPARWLRFAVRADHRFARSEQGLGLEPEELARVVATARELGAERLVFNFTPSQQVLGELAEAIPDAPVAVLGEPYAADSSAPRATALGERPMDWARLLDAEIDARPAELPVPHFGWEAGNDAAATLQPLPFLVLGEECSYARPLATNPAYRGVDLTPCVRNNACAFCSKPDVRGRQATQGPEEIRSQIRSLATTLPPYAGRLAVRLLGEPALFSLGTIASLILEQGLPPSDWLLDARADGLLRETEVIARACDALRGSGHRLHICLIGIENFAVAELERFNKGVVPSDNLAAVQALLRLERDYPGEFRFREHGGLSFILFTPWTTLEDLAFNLRVIQATGLEDVCGKLLSSRLRLEPGLPITQLARRDGLTLGRYDDRALDTAARNLYGPEIPWRFADCRVEPVCRLLVRLQSDTVFDDDPLADRAAAILGEARAGGRSALDLAVELVDCAMAAAADSATSASTEDLLARWRAAAQGRPRSHSGDAQERWAEAEIARWDIRLLAELSRRGIKPVSKIESIRAAELEQLKQQLDLPLTRTRRRPDSGAEQEVELYFGTDEVQLDEAVAWSDREASPGSESGWVRACEEVGRRLGYPTCCSRAFARDETAEARRSFAWLHLSRRIALPGAVPPELNPWAALVADQYVCCSLACEPSIELAKRAGQVAEELFGGSFLATLDRTARHPWLVLLKGHGSALELVADTVESDRIRFKSALTRGRDSELPRVAEADEVIIEPERLLLLRQGRQVTDLSGTAFIWFHERAFQVDFWRQVLELRRFRERSARGRVDSASGELARLQGELSGALARLTNRGVRFGGLGVTQLAPIGPGRLQLVLGEGSRSMRLFVSPATAGQKAWFRVGPFAFSHPVDQPVHEPEHRAVVRDLIRHLGAEASRG